MNNTTVYKEHVTVIMPPLDYRKVASDAWDACLSDIEVNNWTAKHGMITHNIPNKRHYLEMNFPTRKEQLKKWFTERPTDAIIKLWDKYFTSQIPILSTISLEEFEIIYTGEKAL